MQGDTTMSEYDLPKYEESVIAKITNKPLRSECSDLLCDCDLPVPSKAVANKCRACDKWIIAPEHSGNWNIGEIHPDYGEVQMMGTISKEKYRWFCKDNLVSMIPLSFLQDT
jgi:hypothetical protein